MILYEILFLHIHNVRVEKVFAKTGFFKDYFLAFKKKFQNNFFFANYYFLLKKNFSKKINKINFLLITFQNCKIFSFLKP